jgi:hypothetical protein
MNSKSTSRKDGTSSKGSRVVSQESRKSKLNSEKSKRGRIYE